MMLKIQVLLHSELGLLILISIQWVRITTCRKDLWLRSFRIMNHLCKILRLQSYAMDRSITAVGETKLRCSLPTQSLILFFGTLFRKDQV